jgi:hypothetical protein
MLLFLPPHAPCRKPSPPNSHITTLTGKAKMPHAQFQRSYFLIPSDDEAGARGVHWKGFSHPTRSLFCHII